MLRTDTKGNAGETLMSGCADMLSLYTHKLLGFPMRNRPISFFAVALFALTACDSSNDVPAFQPPGTTPPAGNASVQLLHASPDAPAVNIVGLTGAAIEGVDYKIGSAALTLPAGGYNDVQVDGILPDGSTTPVIGPVDLEFAADTLYSIIAIGDDLAIEPLILEQPDTDVPAGFTRLRLVHGAPNAPEVSVFLTAPGADLQAEAPVVTFAFGGDAGPVEVPAGGPYQVRVTLPFTPPDAETVVFDTGDITLTDGDDLLITAVENTTSADALEMTESPISLVVMDGTGSEEVLDVNTPAELRAVHASADTPTVDIIVNDDLANPFVPDLSYPDFAPAPIGFAEVPADTYDISVVDSATQTAEPINLDGVTLDAGVTYDILAVNEFAAVEALVLTDDSRRLETAAKVRIVHASTVADSVSADGVDIYIYDPSTVTDISELDGPTIDNFVYQQNTGFLEVAPGTYAVAVTAEGSTDPVIGPVEVILEANGIYTAIARDPRPNVPNDTLGLILLDDFNNP